MSQEEEIKRIFANVRLTRSLTSTSPFVARVRMKEGICSLNAKALFVHLRLLIKESASSFARRVKSHLIRPADGRELLILAAALQLTVSDCQRVPLDEFVAAEENVTGCGHGQKGRHKDDKPLQLSSRWK